MASKKQNLKSGVKSEQYVGLDQRESLTRKEIEERYPICKEAQRVIDVLGKGSDKSSLYHLTEAFRGFSCEMQITILNYLTVSPEAYIILVAILTSRIHDLNFCLFLRLLFFIGYHNDWALTGI